MRIKGVGGEEYHVAGAGQANLNTALGSIGALGALGGMGGNRCGCGGGLFGGLFGGGCNNNDCCNTVSQQEMAYAVALAACQGREYSLQTAREEAASIFAESRRTDDKISGVVADTNRGLVDVGVGVARLDAKVQCLEKDIEYLRQNDVRNLNEAKDYTDCKVNAEAQLRKAGDDNIVAWTQGELNKKIDGVMKIDGGMVSYGQCRPILESCPCGSSSNPYNVNVIIEQAVAAAVKAVSK